MIIHDIFSKKQAMQTITINELVKRTKEGKLLLRDVSQNHVRAIKRYLFDNIEEEQVYFPPIVAHLEEGKLLEGGEEVLSIIDGSHRIKAFIQAQEMMQKAVNSEDEEEMKKGYKFLYLLDNTRVAVQIFEGFTQKEKDQLYIDLNTKGKKVSLSKRISYDSRNHINQITNMVLQLNKELQIAGVEMEKIAIIRPSNKKLLSLTQLRQIVGIFLTGKIEHSTAEFTIKMPLESNEYINLINIWFEELFAIIPAGRIGDYHQSMLASYPLLVSIALYVNNGLVYSSSEKRKKAIIERMGYLKEVDFTSKNEVWSRFQGAIKGKENYFYLANNKKNIGLLVQWLQNQRR